MSGAPYLTRVIDDLGYVAMISRRIDGVDIASYEGRELVPPVRFIVDEPTLNRYVAEVGGDAQEAFGRSTPRDSAALQLLSVHIQEMVLTRKSGQNTLELTPHGLDWTS